MSTVTTTVPERPARRGQAGPAAALAAGIFLVVVGVLTWVAWLGGTGLRNWWALFILAPALATLAVAYGLYRHSGAFTYAVRGPLAGGLLILTVAALFLLNMSWHIWWPLFIILPGLTLLAFGLPFGTPDEAHGPLAHHLYRPWLGWLGAGLVTLGSVFLAERLLGFQMEAIVPYDWWGSCILIPAFGGLATSARLLVERSGSGAIAGNLIATLAVGASGVFALLDLDWNLLMPTLLIGSGALLLGAALRRR